MKKLIVIASAVFMACAVNAAAFTWGFGSDSIENISGDYLEGGTAFLFLGTVTASDSAFDLSSATFLASGGQDPDFFTFGALDSSNPASSAALTTTASGQAFSLILVDRDVSTLAGYEGNYILATGIGGQGSDPMSGDTWATFVDMTAYASGDWQSMSNVPEPTSGLLLLLGMAGLALKRKNA